MIVLAFTLFWYLAKVVHARPMVNAAVTLLGYTYIGVLGGFAGLLLAYPDGLGMLIGLVLCAVAYDIVGYLVGSRMGRRALGPRGLTEQDRRRARRRAWPRRSSWAR